MPRRKEEKKSSVTKKMYVKNHRSRSFFERFADSLTSFFGTSEFLFFHVLVFLFWVIYNGGIIEGIVPLDPYPFNFLTTVVSLEAIFLSIVVLMSQNRAARIADVRDEVDFQINVQSEREITKILEMLASIEKRLHVAQKADPELLEMLRKVDVDELEERVLRAVERGTK